MSAYRWSSRIDADRAVRFQVNEIYEALDDILEDTLTNISGVKSRAEAKGFVNKITNFKCLCSLVVWYDILYEINISSKLL